MSTADIKNNFLGIRTRKLLKEQVFHLFLEEGSSTKIGIDDTLLHALISRSCDLYHYNPYHNFQHAVDVVNSVCWLLSRDRLARILDPPHRFLLMVAGLVHDLDHRGRSNRWEVFNNTELCQLYSGISVLENHSLVLAKTIFKEIGLQEAIEKTALGRSWEAYFDTIILSTDFELHTRFVKKFYAWFSEHCFDSNGMDEIVLTSQAVIKTADLGNVCKPFHQAVRWARRVMLENWDQWIASRKLGIVDNGTNNPADTNFNKMQINFIEFLARDLFVLMSKVEPQVETLLPAIDENIRCYHIALSGLPMWITSSTTFYMQQQDLPVTG